MSAIQVSGLEECLQFRVWIRGVSAIQGSGLEGCLRVAILYLIAEIVGFQGWQ